MTECLHASEDCYGPMDTHHVLPKRRLRMARIEAAADHRRSGGEKPWSLTRAYADPRIVLTLCRFHHGQVENRRSYVMADQLPEGFWQAAELYGCLGWARREYEDVAA